MTSVSSGLAIRQAIGMQASQLDTTDKLNIYRMDGQWTMEYNNRQKGCRPDLRPDG